MWQNEFSVERILAFLCVRLVQATQGFQSVSLFLQPIPAELISGSQDFLSPKGTFLVSRDCMTQAELNPILKDTFFLLWSLSCYLMVYQS